MECHDSDSDDDFTRARKRQRLSSPTYDNQVELSQEEVAAFDAFEKRVSQNVTSSPRRSQALSESARRRRDIAIALALGPTGGRMDMKENVKTPSLSSHSTHKSAYNGPPKPQFTAFAAKATKDTSRMVPRPFATGSASSNVAQAPPQGDLPSSSPDGPEDQDLATWFESTEIPTGGVMFKSAKDLAKMKEAEEMDDWFSAPVPTGAAGFQSASALKSMATPDIADSSTTNGPVFSGFASSARLPMSFQDPLPIHNAELGQPATEAVPEFVGFTTGTSLLKPDGDGTKRKKPDWTVLSAEALAAAAARVKGWEREIEMETGMEDSFDGPHLESPTKPRSENLSREIPRSVPSFGSARTVLGTVENSSTPRSLGLSPDTPSPAGPSFKRPAVGGMLGNRKPFKSPLMKPPVASKVPSVSSTAYVNSPLNPSRASSSQFTTPFVPPLRPTLPITPIRPAVNHAAFAESNSSGESSPPRRALGMTPRRATPGGNAGFKKPTFVTPFKPGMRPGEPGRSQLSEKVPLSHSSSITSISTATPRSDATATNSKGKGRAVYFDLTKPSNRQTLASCGLVPQAYTPEELESMGINFSELSQITPDLAMYYSFHSSTSLPTYVDPHEPPPTAVTLGASTALNELLSMGCSMATKQWVDNHWGLILWKLAGMVCLDPASESDPEKKRWCWKEVMRQLRYRYERELNSGVRPALRLIAAQDVPASLPMVLSVSNIIWTPGGITNDGTPILPSPELEVTDGWYRVKAEIDAPIVRAIRKGTIRVGRKMAVAGCRLSSGRKDAAEILEAADSITLKIYANSSHLAPWHAKLGIQKDLFIATLDSLTPDGGLVGVMDLVIVKTYPIAYLEFIETEDGQKIREGPFNEKDEANASDRWKTKRDTAASKLRSELEKNLDTLIGYADRLDMKAGSTFRPTEYDSPPDHIEDLLFELEDNPDANGVIKRATRDEAGWLSRAIREKCERDRERMQDEIERELNSVCPPREVRNFRVIVTQDAQSCRRPAQRKVQITVWDVLGLYLSEDGKAGEFKDGQRFLVTNLLPSQQGAWMARDNDSMVYLSTRRDSRWTKL